MKTIRIILILVVMSLFSSLYSKTILNYDLYTYYYNGEKIKLPINEQKFTVYFDLQKVSVEEVKAAYTITKEVILSEQRANNYYCCEISIEGSQYQNTLNSLKKLAEVYDVEPVVGDNTTILVSNRFFVQLKDLRDYQRMLELAKQMNVTLVSSIPYFNNWYVLECDKNSVSNALSLSNLFYESGIFLNVDPGFIYEMQANCVSDYAFSKQWGLRAINACSAWGITKGSPSVNVAIIDMGVDENHDELTSANVSFSYDIYSNSVPAQIYSSGGVIYHGIHVGGIIFSNHNSDSVAGVAPETSLINISHPLIGTIEDFVLDMSTGFYVANSHGAHVINNSWGFKRDLVANCVNSVFLESAIRYVMRNGGHGKGCVVVFASGNTKNNDSTLDVAYPACFNDSILVVGAIDSNMVRGSFSKYGEEIDVVAPGLSIMSTHNNNGYATWDGTSMAAPHVAGVAALILSVNSNLTAQQVRDIIEQTAQKVGNYSYQPNSNYPNGTWNDEMGYGLVDAYAAVKAALKYDLYTRDNSRDNGIEPLMNTIPGITDSPDIWVRNQQDGNTIHQAIIQGTNYLYVRIANRGSDTSWTSDSIKVYTKPAFLYYFNSYPNAWQLLCKAKLPRIAGGRDTVVCIPFNSSDLLTAGLDYGFYTRIESPFDPLTNPEINSVSRNVEDNNNISLKNVLFTNDLQLADNFGLDANFAVTSGSSSVIGSKLRLYLGTGTSNILDNAEVTMIFPEDLMTDWTPVSENIKQLTANTFLVTGETVEISGVPETEVTLRYNFLTNGNSPDNIFKNHITQYVGEDEELVGGLTIQVEKPERATNDMFIANAGNDTVVLLNTTATLHATQINEDATYRWYDKQRNFKYEGLNYTVVPTQSSEYILEVTAESDGYRDLDTVKVNVVPGCIRSITPNPVSDNWVTVSYEYATMVTSAHLYIYNTGTTTLVGNYDLTNLGNVSSLDIEVTNYPTGSYTVVLVCDNAVCHSKVLIRQ